ncbi:MAG: GtrA family protein [Clostridia bacterium]|nr:GtrA family protein [Clostridia bacterium]
MKLIKKIWAWLFHSEKGLYLVFGGLTTIVSLIVFYLFNGFNLKGVLIYKGILPGEVLLPFSITVTGYMIATVLRNVAGILFAYLTNRGMVFGSTAKGKARLREFFKFVSSRLITFALDLIMMWAFVELLEMSEGVAGLVSMVVVIILNYVLSKLFVFSKPQQGAQKEE